MSAGLEVAGSSDILVLGDEWEGVEEEKSRGMRGKIRRRRRQSPACSDSASLFGLYGRDKNPISANPIRIPRGFLSKPVVVKERKHGVGKTATGVQIYAIKMRIMPVTNALMYKTPPRPDPNAFCCSNEQRYSFDWPNSHTKRKPHAGPESWEPARVPSTKIQCSENKGRGKAV
jgi:hypothetical protein